jgi:DNA/RNA endonuclease YhcR with UshA esterase domain
VQEVRERHCPVSGSLGEHFIMKLTDGSTIEVHITTVKFMKDFDFSFAKGDVVEVTGSKVKFEGVDTILAREIKRGNDVFAFRDKDGNPVW